MTIIGEEYLKNESYRKVIFNEDSIVFLEGNEQLTILRDDYIEKFKKMTKKEQETEIIKHFLKTNSVGGIIYGSGNINSSKCVILSEDNKALIFETQISENNLRMIIDAYTENRTNTLKNKPHRKYTISSNTPGVTSVSSELDTLEFSLMRDIDEREIDKNEIKFLEELVESLFENEIISYDFDKEIINGEEKFKGWYLVSEDSNAKIKLDNLCFYNDILTTIIFNHNCSVKQKREKEYNKQLKLEGI